MYIQSFYFQAHDLEPSSKEYTKSRKRTNTSLQEEASEVSVKLWNLLPVELRKADIIFFTNGINTTFVGSRVAPIIQRSLGIQDALCFDLGNSCISTMEAIYFAAEFSKKIDTDFAVLIVSVDCLSQFARPEYMIVKSTLAYWADGMGAMLLTNHTTPFGHNLRVVDTQFLYEGRFAEMEYFSPEHVRNLFQLAFSLKKYTANMRGFSEFFEEGMRTLISRILTANRWDISGLWRITLPNTLGKKERILQEILGSASDRTFCTVKKFGHMGTVDLIANLGELAQSVPNRGRIMSLSIGNGYSLGAMLIEKAQFDDDSSGNHR